MRPTLDLVAYGRQFTRFGLVGAFGFVVHAAFITAMVEVLRVDPYLAGAISLLTVVTLMWFLNRRFTFGGASRSRRVREEWLRFVVVSLAGATLNFCVYAFLLSRGGLFIDYPVIAAAGGSGVALFFNFLLSRWFVFG